LELPTFGDATESGLI